MIGQQPEQESGLSRPRRRAAGEEQIGEAQIIRRIVERFGTPDARTRIGLGDDASVLRGAGLFDGGREATDLVVTTDLLVEGVHFNLRYMSLADVGYKSLVVNLSDLAAMGARATFAFGNLGVPRGTDMSAVDDLLDGVAEATHHDDVRLVGGDTVAAPQWIIGFTLLGDLAGPPLTRSGARPGDILWHSGALGLSQVGLHMLWGGGTTEKHTAVQAHLRPTPQLALGRLLQTGSLANACIDTSDSVSQCLLQLAQVSDVGLHLDFTTYPFHKALEEFSGIHPAGSPESGFVVPAKLDPAGEARRYSSLAEFVLASAEDYQLVFTALSTATERLLEYQLTPLIRLGAVTAPEDGCHYRDETGELKPLTALGFEHLPGK